MKFLLLIPILLLSACATMPPLTKEEMEVRVYKKSDPPAGCKEVAKVTASKITRFRPGELEGEIKRNTLVAGGNAVSLDSETEYVLNGTAFTCP